MILILLFIVASTIPNSLQLQTKANTTLESVQIVFRHGQKFPDNNFEDRTGLLNPVGKQDMYDLGTLIRERYQNLLSETYIPSETRLVSSAALRCIQSIALVAYGLYSEYNAKANWSTEASIPYEPIPVESIPKEFDKWLQVTNYCPRREQLKQKARDDAVEEFLSTSQMKEFIIVYINATGDLSPINPELTPTDRVYGPARYLDLSLEHTEPWALPYRESNLYDDLKLKYDKAFESSEELLQMQRGPFYGMLYNEMVNATAKLTAYASHDFSITALKELFEEEFRLHPTDPPTGSAFLFEVHRAKEDAEPFLEIYFRNGTSSALVKIKEVSGCSSFCPIQSFKSLIEPYIPSDYVGMCNRVLKQAYSEDLGTVNTRRQISYKLAGPSLMAILTGIAIFAVVVAAFVFKHSTTVTSYNILK